MKYFILLICCLFFMNCSSKLDQPENEVLLLDNSVNKNLKISVEAFIENPMNRSYLDSSCFKTKQDNDLNFIYSKDSTFITFRDDKVYRAIIQSKGNFLNYGIEIGQSREKFTAIFTQLFNREGKPYMYIKKDKVEIGCCESGSAVWSFNFEKNKLKSISFKN